MLEKGKKTDPSDGTDGQIMAVSDGLAVDPERAGLPAVRQEKLSFSGIRSPAGVAEHVVIFILGMAVDLQQHDGAMFQGSLDSIRSDPRVKTHPHPFFQSRRTQAAAQKDAGQEIGCAPEVSQDVLVPVYVGPPSDLRKLKEHLVTALVGSAIIFEALFEGADDIHCRSRAAVALVAVLQIHKLPCSTIGSKGDPLLGSPVELSGAVRAFLFPERTIRSVPAARRFFAAGMSPVI